MMPRPFALAIALALSLAAPARAADDFDSIEKVDAHMHLYGEMPALAERARADNFRILTINVNYRDFPTLAVQERDAAALARAYPDRIAFAASFDAASSEAPGRSAPRRRSRALTRTASLSRRASMLPAAKRRDGSPASNGASTPRSPTARSGSRSGRTSACSSAMPTATR